MTLIVTYISKYGIVHASDSNLTSSSGDPAGEGRKTFPIPALNAGLTLAGAYSVAGTKMDAWMEGFIEAHTAVSLDIFADKLKDALENQMSPSEKE